MPVKSATDESLNEVAVVHRSRSTTTVESSPAKPTYTCPMHSYFESAAVIVVLVLLGQVLELRARSRTGSAIKALLNPAPSTARQVTPGDDYEVPLDQVKAGAATSLSFSVIGNALRLRK
jgi:cation transport ATPase